MKRAHEIRKFHVAVVQRRLRNVQKGVMHVQSVCFANMNHLLFCRSRCRRRMRCLSSLLLWSRNSATMVTLRHTSPPCRLNKDIRELKIETFSGRRQLKPDVTSSFVGYCACTCSPPCRRGPVGDVKLVCLALWRKREYLTFISIRFVAFSNQHFADYRS